MVEVSSGSIDHCDKVKGRVSAGDHIDNCNLTRYAVYASGRSINCASFEVDIPARDKLDDCDNTKFEDPAGSKVDDRARVEINVSAHGKTHHGAHVRDRVQGSEACVSVGVEVPQGVRINDHANTAGYETASGSHDICNKVDKTVSASCSIDAGAIVLGSSGQWYP